MIARLGRFSIHKPTHTEYIERCLFQGMLDSAFPRGALCAVLERVDGHLSPIRPPSSTGRVFCSNARRRRLTGQWDFEILLDFRKSDKSDGEPAPLRVWVSGINRTRSTDGLWEAELLGESGQLIRLNANPPSQLAPSRRMRAAVTDAYEDELFPHRMIRAQADAP